MRALRVFFAILMLGVLLSACNKNPKPNKQENKEQVSERVDLHTQELEKKLDENHELCLKGKENINACVKVGDILYDLKRYEDAAHAYDQICVAAQNIQACLKLAKMLENGVGVPENYEAAQNIYRTACYRGDKPSCKKVKD